MNKGDDPYEILGVPYDADESQIKKAYFKLAREFHPDKQTTEEGKAKNGAVFAKISDAYDLSNDPVRRHDWKMAKEANLRVKSNPSRPTSHAPQSRPAPRRTYTMPHEPGPRRPVLKRQKSMTRPSNQRPASKRQPPRPAFTRQNYMQTPHEGGRTPQRPGPNRINSLPKPSMSSLPQKPSFSRHTSMPRPFVSKPRPAFDPQQSKFIKPSPQTPQRPVPKRHNSTPQQPLHPVVGSPPKPQTPSVRGGHQQQPQRPGFKRMHSMQPNRQKEPPQNLSLSWHNEQANRPREPNPQQAPTQLHETNPFDVLRINYKADRVEIIHAYRLLAQKYQPGKQPTEESRGHARQKMAQIQKAYEILKDSTKKHEWQLKSRGSGGGSGGGRIRKVLKPADTSKKSFIKMLNGNNGKGEKKKDKKGKVGKKSKASKNDESEHSCRTAETHETHESPVSLQGDPTAVVNL
jgi:curved DNA-binding protein CbpA